MARQQDHVHMEHHPVAPYLCGAGNVTGKTFMFFIALAADYDGTLADNGVVDEATMAALERVRRSRRRSVLVTGRQLEDLQQVLPRLEVFDRVIAENGAVLYRPADKSVQLLADPPPAAFIAALRARDVTPLAAGRVIVATWEPQQDAVLEAINDLGLELQIVFNKGAVMILPAGINKASGLLTALRELALSPINAVAIGDGENDHALLKACGCAIAVANAVPALRDAADWVTPSPHGAGITELVDRLLRDDLGSMTRCYDRHKIVIGEHDGGALALSAIAGSRILVSGASASGKSTFTAGFLERLTAAGLQYCIVDPEGDYEGFEDAISVGDAHQPPSLSKVVELLDRPGQNVAVNLLGVVLDDRPNVLVGLLAGLLQLRERTGRPHWIVVDEAHHMLPQELVTAAAPLAENPVRMMFVTVHPDHMARSVLASVDWLVALGKTFKDTMQSFAAAARIMLPEELPDPPPPGRAVVWHVASGDPPVEIAVVPPKGEHLRHIRKYAVGELGSDKSFYFRGPENKSNLRAQNLETFCQLAEGVDEVTWRHHLSAGDYSRWLRDCIKDEELADEVAAVETKAGEDAGDSRRKIRAAIEKWYTRPP
jgi:hydroxymethylpyrimidine pyrophosphatase-like HAD family hydrolase